MMRRKAAKLKTTRLERMADRFVSIVSPLRAREREAARRAQTTYKATARDHTRSGWEVSGGSPDADILPDLDLHRQRSRQLIRDDATAASVVQVVVDNVIGSGMRAQSRPRWEELPGVPEATIRAFRTAAERVFCRWACTGAELSGRNDWLQLQRLVLRQFLENGESFLVRNMRGDDVHRPYAMTWDVIEADRIESPNQSDVLATTAGNQIRSGIELSPRGVPVAYHVRIDHPGDGIYENGKRSRRKWRRIPAKDPRGRPNIIHMFDQLRPGQSRGVPFLSPVMGTLDHLARFQEAAIVRERVAACWAAFITREDAGMVADLNASSQDTQRRIEDIEPGIIEYLEPGEQVTFGNPSGLGQQYEPFVMRNLRQIGAALGLPYELVAKDFSQTNYSSARASLLEARRLFSRLQSLIVAKLCQPTWDLVVEEAYLRGEFGGLAGADVDLYGWTRATWVTPGTGWVDPVKEIAASELAIKVGVSTLAEEAAAQGRDWEEVLYQQAREQQLREELGLLPPEPPPVAAAPPVAAEPDDDEENDEEEEEDEEDADD